MSFLAHTFLEVCEKRNNICSKRKTRKAVLLPLYGKGCSWGMCIVRDFYSFQGITASSRILCGTSTCLVYQKDSPAQPLTPEQLNQSILGVGPRLHFFRKLPTWCKWTGRRDLTAAYILCPFTSSLSRSLPLIGPKCEWSQSLSQESELRHLEEAWGRLQRPW